MLVVTGTAITKNTPVTVLKKLECAERIPEAPGEPTGPAGHLKEETEPTVPEMQARSDSASSSQE